MRKPRLRDIDQLAQGHTATHSSSVQPGALALLKMNQLPPQTLFQYLIHPQLPLSTEGKWFNKDHLEAGVKWRKGWTTYVSLQYSLCPSIKSPSQ